MTEMAFEDVPEDDTTVVTVETPEGDVDELLLTVVDGDLRGYVNRCQHWTDVRLDDGGGASMRNGEIVCEKHGAMFQLSDGLCTFGPCEGAHLPEVSVEVVDGAISLEEGYQVLYIGSKEENDELDLGSRGGDDF